MFRGIYTMLTGMGVQQARLDAISNNLSNVNNNGYKSERVISRPFGEVLLGCQSSQVNGISAVGNTNMGTVVSSVVTDYSQGQLLQTDQKTDLALSGDGYYTVQKKDDDGGTETVYCRDSSFNLDKEGYLITSRGDYLMGENGRIKVKGNDFSVASDGNITENGIRVDRIKMVKFADPAQLTKAGENYYLASNNISVQADTTTKVKQGFVEKSNVDVVTQMTDMIAVSRSYETGQKLIQAEDDMLNKAINQVGTLR